jgi:hypothetical protein
MENEKIVGTPDRNAELAEFSISANEKVELDSTHKDENTNQRIVDTGFKMRPYKDTLMQIIQLTKLHSSIQLQAVGEKNVVYLLHLVKMLGTQGVKFEIHAYLDETSRFSKRLDKTLTYQDVMCDAIFVTQKPLTLDQFERYFQSGWIERNFGPDSE